MTDRHPGEEQHERAVDHRDQALIFARSNEPLLAIVHSLLAIEARVEESTALRGYS